MLKINEIIYLTSYRGKPRNQQVKVVGLRNTAAYPISWTQRFKRLPWLERSQWLVTVEFNSAGVLAYRSFYTAFLEYQLMGETKKDNLSLFARLIKWFEEN